MSENDLFGAADAPESMTRPLAVRMRPRTLDAVSYTHLFPFARIDGKAAVY